MSRRSDRTESDERPVSEGALRAQSLIGLCLVASLLWFLVKPDGALTAFGSAPRAPHRTYRTTFPFNETPLSEDGRWTNGREAGLNWADVQTEGGRAFGTESGRVEYDDSTALLKGTWGPNQAVEAVVYSKSQDDTISEEVELRLRSSLSAHWATGYEINFRCSKTPQAYAEIVRWDGRLGEFTYLKHAQGSQYGVRDGDVVKGTINGYVITAYINGAPVLSAEDTTYTAGNPGIGFYLLGKRGVSGDYGFSSVTATDGILAIGDRSGYGPNSRTR